MSRTGMLLPVLLLVACAEAPPKALVVVAPISPPIASAAPIEPVATVEPPVAPLLEPPAAVSCALSTTRWRGTKPRSELRVRVGGPVFANIVSGKATLHLPAGGPADGAVLDVVDTGLTVRGVVADEAIWLRPGKPFVLGDAVVPLSDARLGWGGGASGSVGVTFDPGEGIALAEPPLAGTVPCEALAIQDTPFDEAAALPGGVDAKPGKLGLLRAGAAVPLSVTAGGPAIATLTAKAGLDAVISVIGAAGKNTRIVWSRDDSVIFGWVPTAQVEFPKKPPVGRGYGSGSGSGLGRSVHPRLRVVCPDDVTAIVAIDGARWTVGRVLATTTINVMTDEGDYREVVIRGSAIDLVNGAKLLVPAGQIARCPVETE